MSPFTFTQTSDSAVEKLLYSQRLRVPLEIREFPTGASLHALGLRSNGVLDRFPKEEVGHNTGGLVADALSVREQLSYNIWIHSWDDSNDIEGSWGKPSVVV